MSKDNGGAAFPIPGEVLHTKDGGKIAHANPGMTLRDYFAAKALDGCLRYYGAANEFDNQQLAAQAAYEIADAMLAERSK